MRRDIARALRGLVDPTVVAEIEKRAAAIPASIHPGDPSKAYDPNANKPKAKKDLKRDYSAWDARSKPASGSTPTFAPETKYDSGTGAFSKAPRRSMAPAKKEGLKAVPVPAGADSSLQARQKAEVQSKEWNRTGYQTPAPDPRKAAPTQQYGVAQAALGTDAGNVVQPTVDAITAKAKDLGDQYRYAIRNPREGGKALLGGAARIAGRLLAPLETAKADESDPNYARNLGNRIARSAWGMVNPNSTLAGRFANTPGIGTAALTQAESLPGGAAAAGSLAGLWGDKGDVRFAQGEDRRKYQNAPGHSRYLNSAAAGLEAGGSFLMFPSLYRGVGAIGSSLEDAAQAGASLARTGYSKGREVLQDVASNAQQAVLRPAYAGVPSGTPGKVVTTGKNGATWLPPASARQAAAVEGTPPGPPLPGNARPPMPRPPALDAADHGNFADAAIDVAEDAYNSPYGGGDPLKATFQPPTKKKNPPERVTTQPAKGTTGLEGAAKTPRVVAGSDFSGAVNPAKETPKPPVRDQRAHWLPGEAGRELRRTSERNAAKMERYKSTRDESIGTAAVARQRKNLAEGAAGAVVDQLGMPIGVDSRNFSYADKSGKSFGESNADYSARRDNAGLLGGKFNALPADNQRSALDASGALGRGVNALVPGTIGQRAMDAQKSREVGVLPTLVQGAALAPGAARLLRAGGSLAQRGVGAVTNLADDVGRAFNPLPATANIAGRDAAQGVAGATTRGVAENIAPLNVLQRATGGKAALNVKPGVADETVNPPGKRLTPEQVSTLQANTPKRPMNQPVEFNVGNSRATLTPKNSGTPAARGTGQSTPTELAPGQSVQGRLNDPGTDAMGRMRESIAPQRAAEAGPAPTRATTSSSGSAKLTPEELQKLQANTRTPAPAEVPAGGTPAAAVEPSTRLTPREVRRAAGANYNALKKAEFLDAAPGQPSGTASISTRNNGYDYNMREYRTPNGNQTFAERVRGGNKELLRVDNPAAISEHGFAEAIDKALAKKGRPVTKPSLESGSPKAPAAGQDAAATKAKPVDNVAKAIDDSLSESATKASNPAAKAPGWLRGKKDAADAFVNRNSGKAKTLAALTGAGGLLATLKANDIGLKEIQDLWNNRNTTQGPSPEPTKQKGDEPLTRVSGESAGTMKQLADGQNLDRAPLPKDRPGKGDGRTQQEPVPKQEGPTQGQKAPDPVVLKKQVDDIITASGIQVPDEDKPEFYRYVQEDPENLKLLAKHFPAKKD